MKNDDSKQPWREKAWRSQLPPAQQETVDRFLNQHPDLRPAWEEEQALTRILQALTSPPLPSNFTAQVLASVDREAARRRNRRGPWGLAWLRPRFWLPRLALGGSLVVASMFGLIQYREQQRSALAQVLASMPAQNVHENLGVWRDFEAIQRLQQAVPIDAELLAALD